MSEQEPNTGQEDKKQFIPKDEYVQQYVAQYPDAEKDPVKAEVMARASKRSEEAVREYGKEALDAAANLENRDYRSKDNWSAPNALREKLKKAEEARIEADSFSELAAGAYDKVQEMTR